LRRAACLLGERERKKEVSGLGRRDAIMINRGASSEGFSGHGLRVRRESQGA